MARIRPWAYALISPTFLFKGPPHSGAWGSRLRVFQAMFQHHGVPVAAASGIHSSVMWCLSVPTTPNRKSQHPQRAPGPVCAASKALADDLPKGPGIRDLLARAGGVACHTTADYTRRALVLHYPNPEAPTLTPESTGVAGMKTNTITPAPSSRKLYS